MIDLRIVRRLEERGVASCLIGAAALSVHGYARYSADVDVLVSDRRVLETSFWAGFGDPEVRAATGDDPLLGVVRWERPDPLDVVVNDDHASRYALRTAQATIGVPLRVATPAALVLLNLEAGGPLDTNDIVALVQVQRMLNGAPWLADIEQEVPRPERGGSRPVDAARSGSLPPALSLRVRARESQRRPRRPVSRRSTSSSVSIRLANAQRTVDRPSPGVP